MRRIIRPKSASQTGSSLVIALLLLIALALVGFGAATSSLFQERMAGNVRDRSAAFNAAEAGLRDAEQYLRETSVLPLFDGTAGHYRVNDLNLGATPGNEIASSSSATDISTEENWATKKAIITVKSVGIAYGAKTARPALPKVPEQPRFVLEEMPQQLGRMMTYRITSVGFGPNDSVVVLQTYYTPPQFTVT